MRKGQWLGILLALCASCPMTGQDSLEMQDGGIVRGPRDARRIALEFTGHEFAEGGEEILRQLSSHKARGSFYLTGDFLRNPVFAPLVRRMVAEGHYVGPHSDRHLLYCAWEPGRNTLVSRSEFVRDLEANLRELVNFGVRRAEVRYWVPAYEWYNPEVVRWSSEVGLQLVNFTPGTRSNADYAGEADPGFVSSDEILRSIFARERDDPDGLNGFLLLMHVGAGEGRKDKMHDRLGELLDVLGSKGYKFVRVDELLRR